MIDVETPAPVRIRDSARTRHAILRAAQSLFAEQGYSTTGVREVAAAAGVNSTLVRRYFGSKIGLLHAALEDLLRIEPIIRGDRAEFGTRAAAMLLQTSTITNPVAIMMLAMADFEARKLCSELVQANVIEPLAAWLGGEGAADRAAQLNLLWTGFIAQRHLMLLPQLGDDHVQPSLNWIAEVTQAIADGRNSAL